MRDTSPDELRNEVASALGSQHTLERELGGGGMSRVFVARDHALGREVVVKVLAPELAQGISAERFAREIRLAAALQEPHIVPVLSAGVTAGGLPYYLMPFVRGESLRNRLSTGPVPLADGVTILRDIATALEYAHGQGIVHRDIKPENVLLSGRTAVVTDFGIARALTTARGDGAQGESPHATARTSPLTALGMSLGTPAYMAPEQVAGEAVDPRGDVYAWGIIAYELIAGAHPFAGKTSAQQLMAAHLTESPVPLGTARPDVPAPLAALVDQCLQKDPAARPDSAAVLVAALDATRASDAGASRAPTQRTSRRGRRTWRRVAGIGGGLIVAALAVGYASVPPDLKAAVRTIITRPPPEFRVNRVVVAGLENQTGDTAVSALGAMAADLITDALARVTSLEVVDVRTATATAEVVGAIPRLLRPSDDARALAAETGSKVLVTGSYFRDADTLRFRVKVLDAESGRVLQVLPLVSSSLATPMSGLPALAQRVAGTLLGASDRDVAAALGTFSAPPSMAAYEATRAALIAFFRSDSARITLARRAVALDSTYGLALTLLPWCAASGEQFALADSALALAERHRDHLSPVEQAFVDMLAAEGTEATIQAAERALRLAPRSAEAGLALAGALGMGGKPRRAIGVLRQMDPKRGILLFTTAYWGDLAAMYARLGELDRALAAVRDGQRQFGTHGPLRGIEASIEALRGDEAAASKALGHMNNSRLPLAAAGAAARLRASPERDAAGRAFAATWVARTTANRDTSRDAVDGRMALFGAAERWPELLAVSDSVRALPPTPRYAQRFRAESARAVALIHLGRLAEALAADSALAGVGSPFWAQGSVELARARIAAHSGKPEEAVALLARALALGYQDPHGDILALDGDPFLLPLRGNPAFEALLRPTGDDAK